MEKMIPREYPSSRPHGFIGKQPWNSDEGPGVVCFGLKKKKNQEKLQISTGRRSFPGISGWEEPFGGKNREFLGMLLGMDPEFHRGFFLHAVAAAFYPEIPKIQPHLAQVTARQLQLFFPIFSILKSQHFRGKLPIIQHLSGATSALRDPCIPPIPKKSSIPKNRDIFLS